MRLVPLAVLCAALTLALALAGCTQRGPTPTPTSTGPTASAPTTSASPRASGPPSDADSAPGTPATAATRAAFFGPQLDWQDHGDFGQDRMSLVPVSGRPFRTALRVAYPAHSASQLAANSDGTSDGGAQGYLTWSGGPVDQAWLSYWVRFPAGFDFVKGGKLPGLYGGSVTSGRRIPNGSDGFSTRYMWRTAGMGEVYAYLPTSREHGTSLGRGAWTFPTGRWLQIRQHVQLNHPGTADGRVTVFVDDQQVLDQTGLTFRTTTDLRIQGLFFSTFFGGGDSSWASPRNQSAEFADFRLSTGQIPAGA